MQSEDINWTKDRKDLFEFKFEGPVPGFKDGMDLEALASDFDRVKQVLPPEHVEKFWLPPTNAEGERLKKLAIDKYNMLGNNESELELFGEIERPKASKWIRWKTMTLERFYAFWIAKLVLKTYG